MKIGYSYWGFLGDYKEDTDGRSLSTPDGNAAYGGFLISEMIARGHEVIMLQEDRDRHAFKRHGLQDFASFSQDRRFTAYLSMDRANGMEQFPDLDLLLLEWRFPIPGRNTEFDQGSLNFQPDLMRQTRLLNHYADTKTKIVIWDLDYKLTDEDERMHRMDAVLETAVAPRKGRTPRYRVEPPVAVSELRQLTPMPLNANRKLVYVGSRYERDDVIDEWIKLVSDAFPGQVEFFGNWTADYNFADVKRRWPNISYRDRITMKDFYRAYGDAVGVPLLAKRSYLETGFITPRIWEALIFGSIPIGLVDHRGIHEYLPFDLVATDPKDLIYMLDWLSEDLSGREIIREEVIDKISFMDAENFVRTLEQIKES